MDNAAIQTLFPIVGDRHAISRIVNRPVLEKEASMVQGRRVIINPCKVRPGVFGHLKKVQPQMEISIHLSKRFLLHFEVVSAGLSFQS